MTTWASVCLTERHIHGGPRTEQQQQIVEHSAFSCGPASALLGLTWEMQHSNSAAELCRG